jgi:hypothetical protein
VTFTGQGTGVYGVLVGKLEGMRPLGRSKLEMGECY